MFVPDLDIREAQKRKRGKDLQAHIGVRKSNNLRKVRRRGIAGTMKKFKCDDCGELEYALIDGYGVGDRILEGVMFEIRIVNDKPQVKPYDPSDKSYLEDLNEKKWLNVVKDSLKDEEFLQCPNCDADIDNPFYIHRERGGGK